VNYDNTKLTFVQIRQGTGVSAGNFMPTVFPGSVAGSSGGQSYVTFYTGIDYTDGSNIGQTNGIVAELEFTATTDGFCKLSNLASLNQSFVNRLVTAATPTAPPSSISVIASSGMEVSALKDLALTGVPSGVADATDSVDNISYYADAGTVLGTVVTDPGVTAANNCSSRPVAIAITFPNSSTSSTWPARFGRHLARRVELVGRGWQHHLGVARHRRDQQAAPHRERRLRRLHQRGAQLHAVDPLPPELGRRGECHRLLLGYERSRA
jgi:hypothetical protein